MEQQRVIVVKDNQEHKGVIESRDGFFAHVLLDDGSKIKVHTKHLKKDGASPATTTEGGTTTAAPEKELDYTDVFNCVPFRMRSRKATESVEAYQKRLQKSGDFYPASMFNEDGSINFGADQVWMTVADEPAFVIYQTLLKGPITFEELSKQVVAECAKRGIKDGDEPVSDNTVKESIKHYLRGEPSWLPPGAGKLVGAGPAPGTLQLVYSVEEAREGYKLLAPPAPIPTPAK